MPDPTKKTTKKRNLATPLSESRFDPADYNRDGSVSASEQREYDMPQRQKKLSKAKQARSYAIRESKHYDSKLQKTRDQSDARGLK